MSDRRRVNENSFQKHLANLGTGSVISKTLQLTQETLVSAALIAKKETEVKDFDVQYISLSRARDAIFEEPLVIFQPPQDWNTNLKRTGFFVLNMLNLIRFSDLQVSAWLSLMCFFDETIFHSLNKHQKCIGYMLQLADFDQLKTMIVEEYAIHDEYLKHPTGHYDYAGLDMTDYIKLAGIMCLVLSKTLTAANARWWDNRVNVHMRLNNESVSVGKKDVVKNALRFTAKSWNSLTNQLRENLAIEHIVVLAIIRSSDEEYGRSKSITKELKKILRYTGMSHILITNLAITSYSQLIPQDYLSAYSDQILTLRQYEQVMKDLFPFARFVLQSDSYEKLSRNSIGELFALCVGLLIAKHPNLRNLALTSDPNQAENLKKLKAYGEKLYQDKFKGEDLTGRSELLDTIVPDEF